MKMETATKKRKLDPTKPSKADSASCESSRLATYTRWLKDQNILGYARDVGKKVYTKKYYEIDPAVLRATMAGTFKRALLTRCLSNPTMSNTSISTYIEQITPCVVDMCVSALYAKLRSIHKLYGQHGTRYTTSSAYDRDFELPLPFAMAIQELGVFQTHSLETNHFCIPTFPEGTTDEGRSSPAFPGTEYMSCLPFLKGNGIPCKSVDTHLNRGTAWWTYKAEKVCGTFDLVCTLPASHYDDGSAVLRSVFLTSGTNEECPNFVAFEDGIANCGTRLREFQPGRNVCSFLALCHAPEEEWSVGRN